MKKELQIKNPLGKDYQVQIADDFSLLVRKIRECVPAPDRIGLISDSNTGPLYEAEVSGVLAAEFPCVRTFSFEAGEENKNAETIGTIYDFLLEEDFTRKSLLISLGGGVCGDMTGFAAATYRRGIPFIQIPTTLLAQVDASIGGKTGFDYRGYKNMIGAFHMPSLVYVCLKTLKTLTERDYNSGIAENLKHALIRDEKFFEWMLDHMDGICERDPETVGEMVLTSVRIKQAVVEEDPTEQSLRMILNFGHTLGHAIEKYKDFRLTHGECVALGCLAAADISCSRGYLQEEELYELRDIIVGFGLPAHLEGVDTEKILQIARSDKKAADGHVRFILLKGIGKAFIADDVTEEEMKQGIDFINGDLMDNE